MKSNSMRFVSLFAVMLVLCFAGLSPAQDESGPVSKDVPAKNTNESPETGTAERAMPDIAGIWEIPPLTGEVTRGLNRIQISRSRDDLASYECKMLDTPKKTAFVVKWAPESREFRGIWPPDDEMKGTTTLTLRPDKRRRAIRFDAMPDDETRKSLEAMKDKIVAETGVSRKIIDKAFEEELHNVWKWKSELNADGAFTPIPSAKAAHDSQGSAAAKPLAEKTPSKVMKSQPVDLDNALLCFTATWNGPSQQMLPIISELERLGYPIRKIDIDTEKALLEKFNVESVPCFLLVAEGKEMRRETGITNETVLLSMFDALDLKVPGVRRKSHPVDRVESEDIILVETREGLSAYSKSLEKWDRVMVGLPKNGESRLKINTINGTFATVIVDDQLFAFSSSSGRWSKLKIPAEFVGKTVPNLGRNVLSVHIGDKEYVLSPKTGQWTSSDGDIIPGYTSETVSFVSRFESLLTSNESQKPQKLTVAIAEHEELASRLADQIRTLTKGNRPQEKESPELNKLRARLQEVLTMSFDFKSQLQKLRVHELQTRISQIEQQISQRQGQRDQIIQRRAQELIQGKDTSWATDEATPSKRPGEDPKVHSDSKPVLKQPDLLDAPVPERPDIKATEVVGTAESLAGYKELALRLLDAQDQLAIQKKSFQSVEQLRKEGRLFDGQFEDQKRQLDSAERRLQILKEDYQATLRDLKLQIASAQLNVDKTHRAVQYTERLAKDGVVSKNEVADTTVPFQQAKISLERLQARYELFQKAGEVLAEQHKTENNPDPNVTTPPSDAKK